MKTTEFNLIKDSLIEHTHILENHLDSINSLDDVYNLSIKALDNLYKLCKEELSVMDKFITADLYHIIGMGKLSASQLVTFNSLVKNYLRNRSKVKYFAGIFIGDKKIIPTTFVNNNASYNLKINPAIFLDQENGAVKEEDFVCKLENDTLRIADTDVEKFARTLNRYYPYAGKVENIINKMLAEKVQFGIAWKKTLDENNNIVYEGVVKNPQLVLLKKIFN